MKDIFPIPPIPALSKAVQPIADQFGWTTFPFHVHEVLAAATLYTFVQRVVSPLVSNAFAAKYYKPLQGGKRVSWDSHVVSLVQSLLINGLALWCMFADTDRHEFASSWQGRVWAYSPNVAMIQSMAAGYFLWDLCVTSSHLDAFGIGLLAHAMSALTVFSFGYRPFLNYYGPVFILYELSTPFLNVHWFCDKLHLTGSNLQLYNGIALISTFFGCRLIYGNYMSFWFYHDMWNASRQGPGELALDAAGDPSSPMYYSAHAGPIPLWLFVIYTISNVTLNSLNIFWFFKMISAVRKRFQPGAKAPQEAAKAAAAAAEAGDVKIKEAPIAAVSSAVDGLKSINGTNGTNGTNGVNGADGPHFRTVKEMITTVEDDLTEVQ